MTSEAKNHYLVTWQIDVWADSPEKAASEALDIQRRTGSIATIFDVTNDKGEVTRVDLEDGSA